MWVCHEFECTCLQCLWSLVLAHPTPHSTRLLLTLPHTVIVYPCYSFEGFIYDVHTSNNYFNNF